MGNVAGVGVGAGVVARVTGGSRRRRAAPGGGAGERPAAYRCGAGVRAAPGGGVRAAQSGASGVWSVSLLSASLMGPVVLLSVTPVRWRASYSLRTRKASAKRGSFPVAAMASGEEQEDECKWW